MEQRLARLFASIANSLDSQTYTYSDSEYLVRKALIKFLDEGNSLVASARQVPDTAEVVDAVLNYVVSTDFNSDPDAWYSKAATIVVDFADFAYTNEMSEESARFAALLPEGHPRVARIFPITASAQRAALAEWMAADPRLDEDSSVQVRKLYSFSDDSEDVEVEFEYLKAEALVASGKIPEDLLPLTAGFNMSRAMRSMISKALAKLRRRDRKGRFANEFGRLSLIFRDKKGRWFSKAPRIAGPGSKPNTYKVEFDGSDPNIPKGVYEVDASLGENVKGYLPKKAVEGLKTGKETVAEADKRYGINLDDFLATRTDTPDNWVKVKNGFRSKDGKFTARPISSEEAQKYVDMAKERGDDALISGTGAGDAFDPGNPDAFLVADSKGRTKGVAQDWAGIQEIGVANGMDLEGRSGSNLPTLRQPEDLPDPDEPKDLGKPPSLPKKEEKPLGTPPRFPGDKGVPEPTDVSDKPKPPSAPKPVKDVNDMTLEELEQELSTPVDSSKPGSLDRYSEVSGEFYRRGGYSELRKQQAQRREQEDGPDLDQDATPSKDSLSPRMLAEGYQFFTDGEDSWQAETPDGSLINVSKNKNNGKWYVEETKLGSPFMPPGTDDTTREVGEFDSPNEAFEEAANLAEKDWDQDWVDELLSDETDLNQGLSEEQKRAEVELNSREELDRRDLDPDVEAEYESLMDEVDDAIANNDWAKYERLREKAALDLNMPDDVYSRISDARDWMRNKENFVENAIWGGDRDEIESLLNDDSYNGWRDRLQNALDELDSPDLNQDAPILSEKQAEPATGKQYAMLKEFLDERNFDPATTQALEDALENKNLNKAQASSLIGLGRGADFKEGVDPTKPSDRMINSLQGYLSTKDLTPSEIKETLDSLEADGSRDNVEALLNKLRRKKDKPADLNQGTGSLNKVYDDYYTWEDSYNDVDVMKDNATGGWRVGYSTPNPQSRGDSESSERRFDTEEEALAFAEEIIRQNQEDNGFSRYDELLRESGDFDQDVKGTLEDAATDKQWGFLESLLNGKQIDDPTLKRAVITALEDRNLTKGEVGAFIGQLRPLADKPDVRREPSAKQIASIKRGILERDLTPEERKNLEDRLAAGMSFDEASEALNELKSRDITAEGMNDLLDNMLNNQDLDGLKYLLSKPEYADYADAIRDTAQALRRDQGTDQDFDPDLDIDLNQDAFGDAETYEDMDPENQRDIDFAIDRANSGFDKVENDLYQQLEDGEISQEELDSALDELNSEREEFEYMAKNHDYGNLSYFQAGGKDNVSEISEAAEDVLEAWNAQSFADTERRRESSQREDDLSLYYESVAEEVLGTVIEDQNSSGRPRQDSYDSSDGRVRLQMAIEKDFDGEEHDILQVYLDGRKVGSQRWEPPEGDNFWTNAPLRIAEMLESGDDADLNQDAGRSVSRDDVAEKLADDIDAKDVFLVSGDELISALDSFDAARDPSSAAEMIDELDYISKSLKDANEPELSQRVGELADSMRDEMVDRYGLADAGRVKNGIDSLDLSDARDRIEAEREMFFETDVDVLEEKIDLNDSYGDARSGGAEVFVSQEDDGTWTASVTYDRDDDQFNSEDRSEVVRQAAEAAADYNRDTIPSSYQDGDDLEKESSEAKSPEQASEFADKLDSIADDLEGNRGDPDLANDLRESAENIRDAIARRETQNQSRVPDDVVTPETMDEMARDRSLNPNAPEEDSKKA